MRVSPLIDYSKMLGVRMATDPLPVGHDILRQALAYMEAALELLDRSGASPHIGARLDHAICDLRDAIDVDTPVPHQGTAGNRPS